MAAGENKRTSSGGRRNREYADRQVQRPMSEEERIRYERQRAARKKRKLKERRRRKRIRLMLLVSMGVLVVCLFMLIGKLVGAITASAEVEGESVPENTNGIAVTTRETREHRGMPETIEIPSWIVSDLIPVNEYSRPGTKLEEVNGVVVHYTGNPGTTAEQNNSYFKNLAETHETKASSNFLIGMDGKIIMNVPVDEVAYCSNERNWDTISIECCHPDKTGQFTQETYDSLVKLVTWLCETFELGRDDVIRHYDVTGKECPLYYVENEDAWERFLEELPEGA